MKRITALLMTLVLLFTTCTFVTAGADTAVTVSARTIFNIRSAANIDASVVCNVPKGQKVTLLAYSDTWCYIQCHSYKGYAKTSWLSNVEAVKGSVPTLEVYLAQTTGSQATTSSNFSNATVTDLSLVPVESSETAAGSSENDSLFIYGDDSNMEPVYDAVVHRTFHIRQAPDMNSYQMTNVKKKTHLLVLAYGEEWCKVSTLDWKYVGYCKTSWLFHYHSYDPFQYPVPGWEQWHSDGYVVMTAEEGIYDSQKLFGTFNLQIGDIITVQKRTDDTDSILLHKELVDIPATSAEYHEFVNWREAKAGDIIGGGTQFYGQKQGGAYYANRKKNIAHAMSFMDGTIIKSGEEYSFLTNIGPVTTGNGYLKANVTGGAGSGTGGGTCHTSTLMYESVLSLPFLVTEREPHTEDGNNYAPLEFDATVGAYSDFQFVNTLPYDVKMHAYIDKVSGCITVLFECLETVDSETLANWDGTAANVRSYEYHR